MAKHSEARERASFGKSIFERETQLEMVIDVFFIQNFKLKKKKLFLIKILYKRPKINT